jgi:fructokinase
MRIGVDLGGTKIEVIAVDDAGRTLMRARQPTPSGDYPAILDCIELLVQEAERTIGASAPLPVGIATPGAISKRSGMLKNSNSTVLNGKPLRSDLAARLRRPVRLENDANCFALSEAVDGAGAAHEVVFGVILGTGVGGGIVVAKQLQRGRNLIAGEWGHNPLPWMRADESPGPPCYCGKAGCIETYLSGVGMRREFRVRRGGELSAEQIVGAAAAGDVAARACLEHYFDRLARALASVVNVLDPDVIVIGGGLSNIEPLYREVPPRLSHYAFSDGIDTPVVRARHGDSSGVRGAAWLWPTAQ